VALTGPGADPGTRIVVDWLRCDAHGVCAELLPEVLGLDDWGYPVVRGPVPVHLERLADRARASCPALALKLVRDE
jgi:ferredoxin